VCGCVWVCVCVLCAGVCVRCVCAFISSKAYGLYCNRPGSVVQVSDCAS
jgi:hypothetical protein